MEPPPSSLPVICSLLSARSPPLCRFRTPSSRPEHAFCVPVVFYRSDPAFSSAPFFGAPGRGVEGPWQHFNPTQITVTTSLFASCYLFAALCSLSPSLPFPYSVIPTGVADFFLRAALWRVGHGVEGPWQHFNPTQIPVTTSLFASC